VTSAEFKRWPERQGARIEPGQRAELALRLRWHFRKSPAGSTCVTPREWNIAESALAALGLPLNVDVARAA
jgi:hypothetical protein